LAIENWAKSCGNLTKDKKVCSFDIGGGSVQISQKNYKIKSIWK